MNRRDIQRLQASRGHPSVSILLPTHRTSPDNKQDPILLRNLVKQASERLLSEFPRREVAPLLEKLEALAARVDFRNTLDGLALFVNQEVADLFYLPITVKERVIIGETFYIRDLVHALNRSIQYWVLVLSEKPSRLFSGQEQSLSEVNEYGFPMTYVEPEHALRITSGEGTRRTEYEAEQHRQFFRQVDTGLGKALAAAALPVVVAGVERHLAFFKEVSRHGSRVVATLQGSYDETPAPELARRVWPLMEGYLAERRKAQLQALAEAVGAQRYASGIVAVWRAAHEGRGATLLVEEDYHFPGRVSGDGLTLWLADNPTAPDTLADAVDDLIETVLAKGGEVVFVESGALATHQHIALITRF